MKKIKVSIQIESENGKYTQDYTGAIPVKRDKIGTFELDADDNTLVRLFTNIGGVYFKSISSNEDSFSKNMLSLKEIRDKFLKDLNK